MICCQQDLKRKLITFVMIEEALPIERRLTLSKYMIHLASRPMIRENAVPKEAITLEKRVIVALFCHFTGSKIGQL